MSGDKVLLLVGAVVMAVCGVIVWFGWQHDEGIKRDCRDRGGLAVQTGFNDWTCVDDDIVLEDG